MTRSRKLLAALGMLLMLALAGCVRFQADLSVDDQNLLDGDIVVAVITNDDPGSADAARENADKIEAQLLPGLRGSDGVTAKPYEQDDYVGTVFTLDNTPIEALSSGSQDKALLLTRTGDRFIFSGVLDFTPGDNTETTEESGEPADADIRVSMHFPGEVIAHNGQLNGTTVTWTTTLEGSVEMRATASAAPAPMSTSQVLGILAVILVPLIAIAAVGVLILRRRRTAA